MAHYELGVVTSGYVSRANTEDGPIEFWVETFHVGAQDGKGNRWALPKDHGTEAEAEAALAVVRASGGDPGTQPDEWYPMDPCYGSEAWGPENDYELACFEADCFNEPRPNWA